MMLVAHPTFRVSKLKQIHENKKRKDQKHAYHLGFDLIEHKLVGEVECILTTKQTRKIGKQYLVKWKGCHPKKFQWVKFAHLNHLPEMVKKFEHECGHKMWKRKAH